jgi:hypothetical protein
MHIPLASVRTHTSTALCRQGTLLQQKEALLETYCHAREVVFSVRGTPLELILLFQYLGCPLSCFGDDWVAIRKNLDKARSR